MRARAYPHAHIHPPAPARRLLTEDVFADVIAGVLGLLFTLAFLWPVSKIVQCIVNEKEIRMKVSHVLLRVLAWMCVFMSIGVLL